MHQDDQVPPTTEGSAVPPPLPPPLPPRESVRIRPEFHGRAGEYFGIWIVNVLLSILTIGIYGAWAKVRTERYFYGNTLLAGSSFEYLADPIRILKGRLIAYAVVIVLLLSSHFLPVLYLLLLLVLMLLSPLIVFLALRFRARYSAWRGVRFGFDGSPGAAYGPFLGWPVLAMMTMTLLMPLATQRQHAYIVDGHRFGHTRFSFSGDLGEYYKPYLIAFGVGIGLMATMVVGMIVLAIAGAASGAGAGSEPPPGVMAAIMLLVLGVYAGMFLLMAFLRVRYTNLLWRSSRLDGHRFESTLRARDVIWIYASNLVVVILTLGLATPWAMVRLARYRAGHFAVQVCGDLDAFVGDNESERSSIGSELGDSLDFGVDLGL